MRNVIITAVGALLTVVAAGSCGSQRMQGFRAESFDRLPRSAGR